MRCDPRRRVTFHSLIRLFRISLSGGGPYVFGLGRVGTRGLRVLRHPLDSGDVKEGSLSSVRERKRTETPLRITEVTLVSPFLSSSVHFSLVLPQFLLLIRIFIPSRFRFQYRGFGYLLLLLDVVSLLEMVETGQDGTGRLMKTHDVFGSSVLNIRGLRVTKDLSSANVSGYYVLTASTHVPRSSFVSSLGLERTSGLLSEDLLCPYPRNSRPCYDTCTYVCVHVHTLYVGGVGTCYKTYTIYELFPLRIKNSLKFLINKKDDTDTCEETKEGFRRRRRKGNDLYRFLEVNPHFRSLDLQLFNIFAGKIL